MDDPLERLREALSSDQLDCYVELTERAPTTLDKRFLMGMWIAYEHAQAMIEDVLLKEMTDV